MSDATADGLRQAFSDVAARGRATVDGTAEETFQALTFRLGGEWYGFHLADLVEIVGGADVTPIPFAAEHVAGVINHRGSVVPVVELKRVFGLAGRYRHGTDRIVLVASAGLTVGFTADEISAIVTAPRAALEPPLSTMERVKADYIEGCVRQPEGLLVILSAHALIHELRARTEG
jgi:purine-binding chemotaxis protein CheW